MVFQLLPRTPAHPKLMQTTRRRLLCGKKIKTCTEQHPCCMHEHKHVQHESSQALAPANHKNAAAMAASVAPNTVLHQARGASMVEQRAAGDTCDIHK